jgi:hypothetical protein
VFQFQLKPANLMDAVHESTRTSVRIYSAHRRTRCTCLYYERIGRTFKMRLSVFCLKYSVALLELRAFASA